MRLRTQCGSDYRYFHFSELRIPYVCIGIAFCLLVGKRLRQLTKHRIDRIRTLASEVVEIWKEIIVKEVVQNRKNGEVGSVKITAESHEVQNLKRAPSLRTDQEPDTKKIKADSSKYSKSETSLNSKAEKVKDLNESNAARDGIHAKLMDTKVEKKPSSGPNDPPKLTSLVSCKDPLRDKVREILSEALSKVYGEVDEDELKDTVSNCDPMRVAVMVESAMFEKWGKSNGAQKFKYRSIMFNIKDPNNPDFRRKVLIGDIAPHAIVDLTPEEMASDERQFQNEKIKQKALFNSERAAAPKASTNQFTCGRCRKKECTYYQMQTRSADEPMTTYVTCVNCGHRWKFC
ncbi:hypothetical protein M569_02382 [Genlisea aurea]|uniref:Transcription elongation factor n=1 Tax=Genlisea aurea TaxID=192259 RepID=S8EIL0_9LAMI|nr:hypothetical protein M569_02382 [Genlisea aurea]